MQQSTAINYRCNALRCGRWDFSTRAHRSLNIRGRIQLRKFVGTRANKCGRCRSGDLQWEKIKSLWATGDNGTPIADDNLRERI